MECTFVSPFKTFAGIKDLGVQINYCRHPPHITPSSTQLGSKIDFLETFLIISPNCSVLFPVNPIRLSTDKQLSRFDLAISLD